MSAHRLCEAYGAHEAYCPMYGFPLEVETAADVVRLERERLRAVLDGLPTNHVNWYNADGEHEEHCHVFREWEVLAALPLAAPETRGEADPEYMCPNCVTPWKCNGPHIAETPTTAENGP